uniref:Inter-alpha-trypsin inhibitor heavy chain family member 6 n=1 Tax=Oryzias sinensis TaxID=183150 RepID=A0A8C7XW67_9TELE
THLPFYFLCVCLCHSNLKVTDYHVRSTVVSRYAVTTVQSSVWNQLPVVKEAAFEVDLPSSAFISNFTITSCLERQGGGVTPSSFKLTIDFFHHNLVQLTLGAHQREIEKFRVAVSVPSGTRMSFLLAYEELLSRRLGRYELSLGLRPGQLVQNLTVDVRISERTGISFIKVLPLKTKTDAPVSSHVEKSATCARVQFSPTVKQQSNISSKGLNADFIIQYDVDLKDLMGDIQVYDGYFVHYFAPRGLPVVPKDVIFVIDISGSMIGNKIKQTKQAMTTILGDLREGDHFNIITFSDKVQTWKKGRTVRATRQNVREAQEFVRRIMAEGWTNINAALLSAAQLLNPSSSSSRLVSSRVPLVIFLTDGEATIGVTSGDIILNNARKALGSASLFGLAFGDDADLLLLKRLALENGGVARMVYEDADAALQLKGFYDEVASPLLSDIQLSYLDDQAFDVTRSLFPNYFQGSELVVAGRVRPGVQDLKVSMSATDLKEEVKLENDVDVSHEKGSGSEGSLDCLEDLERISSFVHRLWAYFTIRELSVAKLNTTDPSAQRLLTEKATNLSLKYNFVTPFTSLVVVKPDAEEPTTTPPMANPTTTAATSTHKPAAFLRKHRLQSKHSQSAPNTPKPNKTSTPTSKCVSVAVDGDPHFVLQLPRQRQSLCFTVDGKANDVLRLLEDPEKGIIVDGRLLGAPSKHGVEGRSRTYFDQLILSSPGSSGEITVTVSLDAVAVEGEGRDTLPINQQGSITRQGVTVTVDNHQGCWIELVKGVRFLVLFHHYKHPSYLQMAHLGFYITNGWGLSASTQGLLGKQADYLLQLTITFYSWLAGQFQHMLKDSLQKRHPGKCWVVPKAEVERLLGHPYDSYVVNHV